jgi:uncharacterized protein
VIVRAFYNVVGTLFVGLGVLGILLPLMPTTIFLILASGCYLRGSPRLYRMLMTNRHLGPYIRNMKEGRGMPLRAKVVTLGVLWLSLSVSVYRLEALLLILLLLGIGAAVTAFIVRMDTFSPHRPTAGAQGR